MLRISRLTDYATIVMTCLASDPEAVHSTARVAECAHLELPTVSKLMKRLVHAGLVESFRGASGGYRLARPAALISLAQIVEALEGPLGMTQCSISPGRCEREAYCGVRGSWLRINRAVVDALQAVSLCDLMRPGANETSGTPLTHA